VRNLLMIIVAALAGAAAGVWGSQLVRAPAPMSTRAQPERSPPPPNRADPRMAALERRLLGVEQQLSAPEPGAQQAEPQQTAPTSDGRPEARAEHERQAEAEHEAALAGHRLEPRDAGWAAERERTLTEQVAGVAHKIDVELLGIECRTRSCVAQLRWADRDAARAHLFPLLDETALLGCARRIHFPQTGAVPYEAELYLECPRAQ
jgi:hypothetical protein